VAHALAMDHADLRGAQPGPGLALHELQMAGFAALGDASTTLRNLIDGAMGALGFSPPPLVELNDLSATIALSPSRVTIFLYEITEDASVRNAPMIRENVAGVDVLRRPPLPLMLRYLITAWNSDPATHHTMVGRIAQVLNDHAVVSGNDLVGSLQANNEALRIKLISPEIEERSRVWHAIQQPYRLSLYCELRVVRVQSEPVRNANLVTSARTDERRPEVSP
jgi:hypothetical protein